MQIPMKVTYRNLEPTEAIEAAIRKHVDKLEQFAKNITSCRVVVEVPHQHHHKGQIYVVSVDITLPGNELVANRHPDEHHAHEDFYVALRDAFNAAQRQLERFVERQRGKIKEHDTAPHGQITELFPYEDYGLIATTDGRSIYFHRNSVLNANFDTLEVGMPVHFNEVRGDDGPQASTVYIEGKHHVV